MRSDFQAKLQQKPMLAQIPVKMNDRRPQHLGTGEQILGCIPQQEIPRRPCNHLTRHLQLFQPRQITRRLLDAFSFRRYRGS